MQTQPPSRRFLMTRIAFASALFTSALWVFLGPLIDPLGIAGRRADDAASRATTHVVCGVINSFRVQAHPNQDALTSLADAVHAIHAHCPPPPKGTP